MQLKPGIWVGVRALIIVLFVVCALGDGMSGAHLSPVILGMVFVFGIFQTRLGLLGVYQRLSPDEAWLLPCWKVSPFQFRQPFQFAHVTGYALGFCGLAAELREIIREGRLPDEMPVEMLAGVWGLGLLIGIEWAVRAYPQAFRRVALPPADARRTTSMKEAE